MVKYYIVYDGSPIPLNVVSRMEFGGRQSVIVYEAPGSNGGTVVTTGRTNNKITLTGRLILPFGTQLQRENPNATFPQPLNTLNNIKSRLQQIRDSGKVVQLQAPVTNDDTGNYIIEEFTASLEEGNAASMPFTMTLVEYRQANIRQAQVNLVHFAPAASFVKTLEDRGKLVRSA